MRKSPMNKFNLIFAVAFTAFPIVFIVSILASPADADFSFFVIFLLLPFLAVGVFNWVAYGKIVKRNKLERKIKKEGTPAYATFIQEKCNTMINTTPVFSIKYCWNDVNENYFENESLAVFYESDIEWFKKMKVFKIKYIGRNSAIVDEMNFADLNSVNVTKKINEDEIIEPRPQNVKYCANCGIKLQNGERKCHVCGDKN